MLLSFRTERQMPATHRDAVRFARHLVAHRAQPLVASLTRSPRRHAAPRTMPAVQRKRPMDWQGVQRKNVGTGGVGTCWHCDHGVCGWIVAVIRPSVETVGPRHQAPWIRLRRPSRSRTAFIGWDRAPAACHEHGILQCYTVPINI